MREDTFDYYDELDAAIAETRPDEADFPSADPYAQAGHILPPDEYAAKKKAEREAAYTLADQSAMTVAGSGEMLQKYLNLQARLKHANPNAKGDGYSTTNALLILAQKPNATRLASYEYWMSVKCPVTSGKGSGLTIIERDGTYARGDGTLAPSYDAKKVFDISQVDTKNLTPENPKRHTEAELLKSLVMYAFVKIERADELPNNVGAMYEPVQNMIYVRRGMEFAETFRSLTQALAYADLTTGPDTQICPELSSFCASYMLCRKYGVDTQSFDFSNAPELFTGLDAQEIKGELSQIRDAANGIAERMSRTLEPPSRSARTQDAGAR